MGCLVVVWQQFDTWHRRLDPVEKNKVAEARKITCRNDTDSAAVMGVQPWTSQKTRVAETLDVIVTGTKR